MKKNCKKLNVSTNEKWEPLVRMGKIAQPDELIEGYCIPLDGREFRIFVADERVKPQRGYFIKLMYEWGQDETINLNKQKDDFPQTTKVFNSFLPKAWVNQGKTRRCYKYIIFGHGESNKHLALSLMHSIVASIV